MRFILVVILGVVAGECRSSAAERPVANYNERKVQAHPLPDPLACEDGTPVRDAETWRRQRRPELIELFSREVYGRTPAGMPEQMHWEVTSSDFAALDGKAERREVTIWFTEGKDGPKVDVLIYFPRGNIARRGPWPVFLGLSYGNHAVHSDPNITLARSWVRRAPGVVNNRATDAARGTSTSRWQIEKVIERGYATVIANCNDLCPDRVDGVTEGVGALFSTAAVGQRRSDEWGAIGMWAWGLSRIMDYLASDSTFDASRVAVHGHSRLGKAALWAGAQDERFALVISNESGCGGAKLSRRFYGQTVTDITIAFPFWFAEKLSDYRHREHELPVDQHQLLALIAPRALYVASAEDDRWADPRGEFLGLLGAEPVYQLLGRKGLGVSKMPAVNRPVVGDAMAYHIRTGGHDITAYDWAQYLDFADRTMKR